MEAQERDLSAAGCEKLFIEQVSSMGKRHQLKAALDYAREGDTLVVTKLDRLARSVADLLTMVAHLEGKKVALRVLAMSGGQPLDTGTAIGKLMLAVIGAVGQFEREMMLERQREGIAKAKRDGRYKGRAHYAMGQLIQINAGALRLWRMTEPCNYAAATLEAQDVGGERAQACKDAGIASDAAGVFCEATVADVVIAVLDAPVVADGLGALSGWQHNVADEQRSFAG